MRLVARELAAVCRRESSSWRTSTKSIAGRTSDIGRQTLPGGAFAVHIHVGSYEEAGPLLSRLCNEVVPKRALTVDHERPLVAVYLNDPQITRELHRRTELCIPVMPIPMPLATNDEGQEGYDIAEIARRIAG